MTPQTTLFLPHGAPTFALQPGAAGAAIAGMARQLPQPRAVVVVSAHWDTSIPRVGCSTRPPTIHDFHGFPEVLYRLQYAASGCPEVAREALEALADAGLEAMPDHHRGLDHGAWIPLSLLFPDADVAVVPVSLQSAAGPKGAWALGRALAPLAERGILVIGSGNLTHNLMDYQFSASEAPAYVRSFADWIAAQLEAGNLDALLDYRKRAPDAQRAHPTEEHLLPLFVALGAAGDSPRAERFHAGIQDRVLAMDAYRFTSGVSA